MSIFQDIRCYPACSKSFWLANTLSARLDWLWDCATSRARKYRAPPPSEVDVVVESLFMGLYYTAMTKWKMGKKKQIIALTTIWHCRNCIDMTLIKTEHYTTLYPQFFFRTNYYSIEIPHGGTAIRLTYYTIPSNPTYLGLLGWLYMQSRRTCLCDLKVHRTLNLQIFYLDIKQVLN